MLVTDFGPVSASKCSACLNMSRKLRSQGSMASSSHSGMSERSSCGWEKGQSETDSKGRTICMDMVSSAGRSASKVCELDLLPDGEPSCIAVKPHAGTWKVMLFWSILYTTEDLHINTTKVLSKSQKSTNPWDQKSKKVEIKFTWKHGESLEFPLPRGLAVHGKQNLSLCFAVNLVVKFAKSFPAFSVLYSRNSSHHYQFFPTNR